MQPPPKWSFNLYSRGQQAALLLLLALCFVLNAALYWWPFSQPDHEAARDLPILAAQLREQMQGAEKSWWEAPKKDSDEAGENKESASFAFNPNTVSAEDLQRLGLSQKQADSWIKYRGKSSKRFKKPEDIAKLFVLSEADVARLLPLVDMADKASTAYADKVNSPDKTPAEDFAFDPNTVTEAELRRLGLSERQAESFLKYRGDSPRRFRQVEDLGKLYVLQNDPALLERLQSLASIQPALLADASSALDAATPSTYSGLAKPQGYQATIELPLQSIDINSATAADLEQIRGIGTYWSGKILKFREALGGFTSVAQVGTTFGLPDSTFQAMKPYLALETGLYRQLPINLLTEEELARHPYINGKLARIILRFKEQHGPFTKKEDLGRIKIISAKQLDQLAPYLDFRKE